jgi:hypothetical protein
MTRAGEFLPQPELPPQEEDMTPEQMLDLLRSPEVREILQTEAREGALEVVRADVEFLNRIQQGCINVARSAEFAAIIRTNTSGGVLDVQALAEVLADELAARLVA